MMYIFPFSSWYQALAADGAAVLREVTESLGQPSSLRGLFVYNNQLREVPERLGQPAEVEAAQQLREVSGGSCRR